MPKFFKPILTEGEYVVATAGGGRKPKVFTPADIERHAENATKMLQAGLKIPAPRQHTVDARPDLEEQNPEKGYENLGYWERFYAGVNEEGLTTFYGILDAPGNVNDIKTPAGMISKTLKDTSVCFHDFVDGKGQKWDEGLWHVAVCQHPIEPGQANFTPLPDDYDVVMMSQRVSTMDIGKLLTALSKCGVSLPSDTTMENLVERLYVAVTQKAEGSGGDSLNSKPSGTKLETYPIMMSLSQSQVDAILSAGVVDPATGKPFDKGAFADNGTEGESDRLKKSVVLMSNLLNKSFKQRYGDRVTALISSGRVNEDYAKAKLLPMIDALDVKEAIQMGMSDSGELPSNAVEITLSALEALEVPAQHADNSGQQYLWMSQKPGSSSNPVKPDQLANLSDEDASKLIDDILKM